MSGSQSSSREPWLLRQKLPGKPELRSLGLTSTWKHVSSVFDFRSLLQRENKKLLGLYLPWTEERFENLSFNTECLQSPQGRSCRHPWESFSSTGKTLFFYNGNIPFIFSWDISKHWIQSALRRIQRLYFRFPWIFLTIGWKTSAAPRMTIKLVLFDFFIFNGNMHR